LTIRQLYFTSRQQLSSGMAPQEVAPTRRYLWWL